LSNYDVVETWIAGVQYGHSKSPRTAEHYKEAIHTFCKWLNTTPEKIVQENETGDERQFRRKYSKILGAYIAELSRRGLTSNSTHTRIACVRSFFKYNDLPLSFMPSGKQTVTFHNRDMSKEEIQAVLAISNPREKAFYTIMAQSGVRPDTLCKLKLKDIEPDFGKGTIPCKITIPQEKTKGQYAQYFTFMGQESLNSLKAYLNKRQDVGSDSLLFTRIKSHGEYTNELVSPNTMSNAFKKSLRILRQKGVLSYEIRTEGKRGKPNELRLYCLRKYFKNHANQMGDEYVEFLMGHTIGVSGHYIAKDVEFYRKLYAEKAMPFLRLESATPTETEQTISNLRKEHNIELEKLRKDFDDRLKIQEALFDKLTKSLIERVQKLETPPEDIDYEDED